MIKAYHIERYLRLKASVKLHLETSQVTYPNYLRVQTIRPIWLRLFTLITTKNYILVIDPQQA